VQVTINIKEIDFAMQIHI